MYKEKRLLSGTKNTRKTDKVVMGAMSKSNMHYHITENYATRSMLTKRSGEKA